MSNIEIHPLLVKFVNRVIAQRPTHDELWDLIEHVMDHDEDTWNEFYELAEKVAPDSPEPIRSAIEHLGNVFNVKVMQEY